jgi:thymidylate synthase ThyX
MTIEAKVILDSIGAHSPRLTTFWTRYPKWIHAEHCRHRSMSLCVSSSRAVPVSKNLEEVRSDELRAAPVWWGKEQRGMSATEELSDNHNYDRVYGEHSTRDFAKIEWKRAALNAVGCAKSLQLMGVHKSIVNRILEPFLHVNVLVTCAEPGLMNFFGLRLDKAAQPEMRTLAELMWAAWNESKPTKLEPGQWHLPFVFGDDPQEPQWLSRFGPNNERTEEEKNSEFDDLCRRVSVARCARLSYTSFETGKRSTIEEDLALYDRLITSRPIHASPAEHQATPDVVIGKKLVWKSHGPINYDPITGFPVIDREDLSWKGELEEVDAFQFEELHGNLPGWIQHRKQLPGEAIAELPEAHR